MTIAASVDHCWFKWKTQLCGFASHKWKGPPRQSIQRHKPRANMRTDWHKQAGLYIRAAGESEALLCSEAHPWNIYDPPRSTFHHGRGTAKAKLPLHPRAGLWSSYRNLPDRSKAQHFSPLDPITEQTGNRVQSPLIAPNPTCSQSS